MENYSWVHQLDLMIQQKHMLLHPFYQAWTSGNLTRNTIQKYAKEYYHHVKAFPTYLSALHSRCDDSLTRKCLLNNLIDEEGGCPNHPDLWKSFILALGVNQEELIIHKPCLETQELINHFRQLCNMHPNAAGIAALYSYESQIPAICQTKIAGLKKWYGVENSADYHYFTVHETADVEHSIVERDLLRRLVNRSEGEVILKSVEKTLDALWKFLDSFGSGSIVNSSCAKGGFMIAP